MSNVIPFPTKKTKAAKFAKDTDIKLNFEASEEEPISQNPIDEFDLPNGGRKASGKHVARNAASGRAILKVLALRNKLLAAEQDTKEERDEILNDQLNLMQKQPAFAMHHADSRAA
ncbi:hypothetical protein FWH13_03540 [Candidatus Saccharibacteria bacterium]|nr:hypothetical protein [Candidatus Saccharibacteria bacterium]